MIRKNSVPTQNADNFLKLTRGETGCCGDTAIDCQSTATYVQANSVSLLNILEDGVATALPLVIAGAATAATAQAAVLATLVAAGYYDDDNEDFPGVTVTDTGANLVVVITGDVDTVSLTTSGGVVAFDQDCTREGLCTFAITGYPEGATNTLGINGVDTALGALESGVTVVGTVETAIEAALATAGITAVATVVDVEADNEYNISIAGVPFGTTISLNTTYFGRSGCVTTYV